MFVQKVALDHFRIHKSVLLEFKKRTCVIVGQNASGKTGIIEALQLLATGNSFRAEKIQEMVAFGSEIGRVKGIIEHRGVSESSDNESCTLEVLLTKGSVQGKKAPFRLFSVNDVRRQKRTATGVLKVVSFRPEDMRLVEGSPSRRREFLDMPLTLLYPDYEQAVSNYENTVKRRNKLLEAVREHSQSPTVLQYWNLGVIKYGEVVQKYRRKFLASFSSVFFPYTFTVEYTPSLISADRQAEYIEREILAGHCLIGPHKDDFSVYMSNARGEDGKIDVAVYGSRGQQRLAVLWLKTAELGYVTQTTQELPVLLLDDILSELDSESRGLVVQLLGKTQAIITTTENSGVTLFEDALGAENVQVVSLKSPSDYE